MSPKRGDQAPQPVQGQEWQLVFDTTHAAKGWRDLETSHQATFVKPGKSCDTTRTTPLTCRAMHREIREGHRHSERRRSATVADRSHVEWSHLVPPRH